MLSFYFIALSVSVEKSSVNLTGVPSQGICCFYLAVFKILFLSLTPSMFTIMCVGVDLLAVILLEFH